MAEALAEAEFHFKHPLNLNGRALVEDPLPHYRWLRENAPVYKGKILIMNVYMVSRHEDCEWLLKDDRFVRNRTTATGGGRMPFPIPKGIALLVESMIQTDDPEHRRLRNLVRKAFTPQALKRLEDRVIEVSEERLDWLGQRDDGAPVNLMQEFALPIPVTVIKEMVGVPDRDMMVFQNALRVLTSGLSGVNMLKTIAFDMPKLIKFVRGLIDDKRKQPGDDILTALISAEEEGDLLTEDELVAMVFLLVIAGYETTVHLISNGVIELLQHPAELARLKGDWDLLDTAVEEVLRCAGPIGGTKLQFAREDVERHGVVIPKGAPAVPLLSSANRDPAIFDDPDVLDIGRSPNRHLAFGHGRHYCLGSNLAKLETRVAFQNLFQRFPDLTLADPAGLKIQRMPLWRRHEALPVLLNSR